MGMKSQGGMWCDYCQRPVAGQKATSRARNTVATVTAPLTSGLSLFGVKVNRWHCPNCGQPVRPMESVIAEEAERSAPRKPASRRGVRSMKAGTICIEPGCNRKVPSGFRYCREHAPD